MPCSDVQPTRNVGVASFVTGEAGGGMTKIARRPAALGCKNGYGGRHSGQKRSFAAHVVWSSPRSPQARREQLFPRSRHIQWDDRFCRLEQVAQAMSNLRLFNCRL
jgi:hypothetical protein